VGTDGDVQSTSIVVVEDDASIRKLILDILKMSGYAVMPFSNAEDGLDWIRAHPSLGLLITDIKMPGMSGKDLADALCDFLPDIKVLFISGFTSYSGEELSSSPRYEGHFLGKPFKPMELLSQVEALIGH
jgi:FixJ family two-component response regulator